MRHMRGHTAGRTKRRALLGVAAAGIGVAALGVGSAHATSSEAVDGSPAPQPPDGARASVLVSPNPAAPGQPVTVTGDCGGGSGLRGVASGVAGGPPVLEQVRILTDDPAGFRATAIVNPDLGNGSGPVAVACGGQTGVTTVVTHR